MVTPLIAFGTLLFGSSAGIINFSLYLAKRTRIIMFNWILASCVNLALNLVFIHKWGIVGAAIATAVAYTVAFIHGVYFSARYFEFDWDITSIIKIIFSSTIMAFFIINFYPQSPNQMLAIVVISIFVYFISLIAIKGFSMEEISFLKNFHRR